MGCFDPCLYYRLKSWTIINIHSFNSIILALVLLKYCRLVIHNYKENNPKFFLDFLYPDQLKSISVNTNEIKLTDN